MRRNKENAMMTTNAMTTAPIDGAAEKQPEPHVCPWWAGYFLVNPLRKLIHNPAKILGAHVRPGMRIIDFGAAMGYFSLPMARMVGDEGRVVCIDVQERMLGALRRRAARARLADRIETILCKSDDLGLNGRNASFDLVLAMYVLHEVPNVATTLSQLATALKPGGRMIVIEPKGHVSADRFREELDYAARAGLRVIDRPPFRRAYTALLEKSTASGANSNTPRRSDEGTCSGASSAA
jgi:2-polyprenyl-3-methyl-5-hydroxy-6-metoxy-1,4-benzoquinol methylase